jgi:O-antigen/teichoic acid export membrane protein
MKTKNDHYWLKSGFLLLMQNMSNILFGFGGFYLLVRMLDRHSYGTWTLYMTTVTIVEMMRTGMIQNALIRFLSHHPEKDHNGILSASVTMSVGITLGVIIINVCLAGFLGKLWHAPELENMFYAYSIVYVLSGMLTQFHYIEQAHLSFVGVFVTTLSRQAIFFIYVAVCFFKHYDTSLIRLVFVQAISLIPSIIVEYFFVKKHLRFKFRLHLGWVRNLFNYGKFVFGTSVSGLISSTVDQMMLGAMLSPTATGAFNVAVRVNNLIEIPTNTMAVMVFPQSAKRMATEGAGAIKYLYERSVGIVLALVFPCFLFLMLFPTFVVHFIAGDKFPEAVPIMQLTILSCFFVPFSRQFGTILDSIGKQKTNFVFVLFAATLNIGLNFFMIRRFGIMGAVYATLLANVVTFVFMQVILTRKLKVRLVNTLIYAVRFYPEFFQKYTVPFFKRVGLIKSKNAPSEANSYPSQNL